MTFAESSFRNSELQFTRKEKELLDLLEGNPGRCFSRTYLLKTIWGYGDETRTRTLDVHVSRLRKKLRRRRGVTIHAVFGQGYVLQQNGFTAMETRSQASPPTAPTGEAPIAVRKT